MEPTFQEAGCQLPGHVCDGDCGGAFVCSLCSRRVGWCDGADDEEERIFGPDLCSACADHWSAG